MYVCKYILYAETETIGVFGKWFTVWIFNGIGKIFLKNNWSLFQGLWIYKETRVLESGEF